MQVFHIRYRNVQGALMRILNAVSRRGLDLPSIHAEAAGPDHAATLLLEVSHKQIGQLCREWYAIVDVIDVHSSPSLHDHADHATKDHGAQWGPHPPASANVGEPSARAALA